MELSKVKMPAGHKPLRALSIIGSCDASERLRRYAVAIDNDPYAGETEADIRDAWMAVYGHEVECGHCLAVAALWRLHGEQRNV